MAEILVIFLPSLSCFCLPSWQPCISHREIMNIAFIFRLFSHLTSLNRRVGVNSVVTMIYSVYLRLLYMVN